MLNKEQNLTAGDNSTNNQAQVINQFVTNVQGLTKEEAREVLLQIYHDNMPTLAREARVVADERANKLTENLINAIISKSPDLLNAFRDPDMQYALVNAQIAHARLGDDNLADLMIDALVERAAQTTRTLQQIVLNEVIAVLPKLTAKQIDTLTLIFIIRYTLNNQLLNIELLKTYLLKNYFPFLDSLSKENSCYQHLEYSGCSSISLASISIEGHFRSNYPGLFSNGFAIEKFKDIDNSPQAEHVLTQCLHNHNLFQINALNKDVIDEILASRISDPTKIPQIMALHESNLMTESEVKDLLVSLYPWGKVLFDLWNDSQLRNMTLTSVGIAIAISNLRRKAPQQIDMNMWIK